MYDKSVWKRTGKAELWNKNAKLANFRQRSARGKECGNVVVSSGFMERLVISP